MNVTNKFPDYNFKVSTEGFNKKQLQAAYEWLKECAISRGLGYGNLKTDKRCRYYIGVFSFIEWDSCEYDAFPNLPEIKLNIETSRTSFELLDEKTSMLEDLISKLSTQLKEAQEQLNSIKGDQNAKISR
jgi:hypothetical protein